MPKLLTAEQLLDAICSATEVPEAFPTVPLGTRAIVQSIEGSLGQHEFLKLNSPLAPGPLLAASVLLDVRFDDRITRLLRSKMSDREILDELFFATLSRLPTPQAARTSLAHVAGCADRRKAWEDILWALLNSKEFLFRH